MNPGVVLITGGFGRLGPTIACAVEDAGGTPVVTSRSLERAETFNAQAEAEGRRARARVFGFGDIAECSRLVDSLLRDFGAVNGLVNNAYASLPYQAASQPAWLAWTEAARVGLAAPSELSEVLVSRLRQTSIESIVNVASIYGLRAPNFGMYPPGREPPSPVYGAIKAGLINLTAYQAARFGPLGVRANAVAPGGIRHDQQGEFLERYEASVPGGRMVEKAEVASVVMFLLGKGSAGVNGDTVVIDAGKTVW